MINTNRGWSNVVAVVLRERFVDASGGPLALFRDMKLL